MSELHQWRDALSWGSLACLFLATAALVWARRVKRRLEGVTVAAEIVEAVGAEVVEWKALYEEEKRKRLEVLGVIEAIQKERNTFRDWWWKCSLEHGAAQGFMVNEIKRCYLLLRKNNIAVREEKKVLALPEAYEAEHGEPKLLEKRGRIEGERTLLHQEIEDKGVAKALPNA